MQGAPAPKLATTTLDVPHVRRLGISLVLSVVVMIVPVLILLSRSQTYSPVRITRAALASALVWSGAQAEFWAKEPGPQPSATVFARSDSRV